MPLDSRKFISDECKDLCPLAFLNMVELLPPGFPCCRERIHQVLVSGYHCFLKGDCAWLDAIYRVNPHHISIMMDKSATLTCYRQKLFRGKIHGLIQHERIGIWTHFFDGCTNLADHCIHWGGLLCPAILEDILQVLSSTLFGLTGSDGGESGLKSTHYSLE